eukprot:sb/3471423/
MDSSEQTFDYMFKLLIIGNSSVGKTSFLFRYCDNSFTQAFVSTVGIDFKVKTVYRHDKRVKLQIWDTAGQERYRTITTAYYRGAMGFLLMYDISNEESFNAVRDWRHSLSVSLSLHHFSVLLKGWFIGHFRSELAILRAQYYPNTSNFSFSLSISLSLSLSLPLYLTLSLSLSTTSLPLRFCIS